MPSSTSTSTGPISYFCEYSLSIYLVEGERWEWLDWVVVAHSGVARVNGVCCGDFGARLMAEEFLPAKAYRWRTCELVRQIITFLLHRFLSRSRKGAGLSAAPRVLTSHIEMRCSTAGQCSSAPARVFQVPRILRDSHEFDRRVSVLMSPRP